MFHVEPSNTFQNCPICGCPELQEVLECTDHFLTGEKFSLLHCTECLVRITKPQPPPSEIFNYYKSEDYVSHSDTKKGLINFAYQQVKAITLRSKIRLIRKWSSAIRLLDFGCGTGDFLSFAKQQGYHTTGLEPDESARNFALDKGLEVHHPEWIKTQSSTFDIITMWHVLEHTYDPLDTLLHLKSQLNPGGIIIVAVPNYSSMDAEVYGGNWAAYDVPRHLFHFHPDTLQKLAEKTKMTLIETKGMLFDSFYVSMLSEKYSGKNLINGIWVGAKSNMKAAKTGDYSSLIYIFKKQPQ